MRSLSLLERIKNSWLLVVFAIVALILWNTNLLFERLKTEERNKMELWAMAQKESIQNQAPPLSQHFFKTKLTLFSHGMKT